MNTIKILLLSLALTFSTAVSAGSILSPLTDSVNSGILNTKVYSSTIPTSHLNATVIGGVAVFSGEVNNNAQRDELIRIAKSISGIKGVDTANLKVLNKKN
jgi:osmotically-inducible protein OsmY